MESARVSNGSSERIFVIATDSAGLPVTGLTDVLLKITRKLDKKLLDFDDNTFKDSAWVQITVQMTEYDATNMPGLYYYDFNTAGFDDDEYAGYATCASAFNFPQMGELKVGGLISILLALAGKNSKIFDTTYDGANNLTAATIRGYPSKADLEGDTNHCFELTVTGTYGAGPGLALTHLRKDST